MKKIFLLACLLTGMVSTAQTSIETTLVQNLIVAVDLEVSNTNEIFFEDYICISNPFLEASEYIYISSPSDTLSSTTIIKYWEGSTVTITLNSNKVDENCLLEYIGSLAEMYSVDYSELGYNKEWSDGEFVFHLNKTNDLLSLTCRRYYGHYEDDSY